VLGTATNSAATKTAVGSHAQLRGTTKLLSRLTASQQHDADEPLDQAI
jgi:hypothetical protein